MLALNKATAWLRKKQARLGSWGDLEDRGAYTQFHQAEPVRQGAGPTALVLYTLLRSGQSLQDPVLKRGFAYLHQHHRIPATSMERAMTLLAVLATAEARPLGRTSRTRPKPKPVSYTHLRAHETSRAISYAVLWL